MVKRASKTKRPLTFDDICDVYLAPDSIATEEHKVIALLIFAVYACTSDGATEPNQAVAMAQKIYKENHGKNLC